MSHEKLRSALRQVQEKVDSGDLKHLLDTHDHWKERAEKAEAELAQLQGRLPNLAHEDGAACEYRPWPKTIDRIRD